MSVQRIQDLAAPSLPLTGTELVELEQSGGSVQCTTQDIADLAGGGGSRNTVSVLTPAAGVVTIDYALGDYFTLAPTANVTSIVFINLPGAGTGITLYLWFTQDTTPRTVAWPASFDWAGGVAGAVSTGSGAKDDIATTSLDNGTSWHVTIANAFA